MINSYVLKKKKYTPFFFVKFTSLANSLAYTPFFFIKFRLWKYKGMIRLFRFFLKPTYCNKKNFLTCIKKKMKKIGIKFPTLNSFIKLYRFNSNFSSDKLFKISTNDFIYKIKANKNNFCQNCVKFLDKKVVRFNVQYTKINQRYIVKVVRILLREKIYLNGFFFRYFFLKNFLKKNLEFDILRYISFYLMVVMDSKFLIKKPLFAVWCTKKFNCVVGCFSNARACKVIREKNFIRRTTYASLDKFIQLTKYIYLPVLHNVCN